MRKFSFILLAFAISIISCQTEDIIETADFSKEEQIEMRFTWPTIIFGTRSHPCGKDNNCYCEGDRGICLLINPDKTTENPGDVTLGTNTGIGTFELISSSLLKIKILRDNSFTPTLTNPETKFYVYDDIELSHIFDDNITIKQGVYDINYSSNPYGDIIVNYE